MLCAGDQIEAHLGVALSLSSMAAAGLGNALSDVVGVTATDSIEVKGKLYFLCDVVRVYVEEREREKGSAALYRSSLAPVWFVHQLCSQFGVPQ